VSKPRKRKSGKKAIRRTRRPAVPLQPTASRDVDAEAYLHDLPPTLSPSEVENALDRRMFAMPYLGATIGGEEFPVLDPADPDERGLLIQGEHPEYHAVLADTLSEAEIDGVNPRLHVAIHEIIANQLWDGDPPEVWRAARRLRDRGMDRHDILHALMSVQVELMHPVLVDKTPFDIDAYRQALDDL
jgi:hypothetical protein